MFRDKKPAFALEMSMSADAFDGMGNTYRAGERHAQVAAETIMIFCGQMQHGDSKSAQRDLNVVLSPTSSYTSFILM
jgi:hypothetical protein